jgi:hypothetical protein
LSSLIQTDKNTGTLGIFAVFYIKMAVSAKKETIGKEGILADIDLNKQR